MKTSKSLRIISLSILSIFLSCTQIESVTETYPYSINAGCNTKTVNDGNLTYWADGDEMSVLFDGDNSCYGKFTRKEDNRFSGEFNQPAGSGDWYGLYPYSSKATSPSSVSITVPTSSAQAGNDSRAHLAGSGFPLYGCAKDVEQGKMPTLPMHQALTVVRFVITNTEAEPLIVTALEFTAPTDIAGEFTADLTADKVAWTKVPSKTSNTIRLDVTESAAIANGEAAEFYIGMIPFAANGKATLKVYGITNGISVSSTVEFTKNFNYLAGAINKLKYNYVRTAVGDEPGGGPTTEEYYIKLTSAPSDWSGKYLIVHTSSSYAFATYTGYPSGYRQTVTIDKNGKILSNESSDKCAFTIKKTTTSGQYNIINSEGKYISANSGKINIGSSGENKISYSGSQISINGTSGTTNIFRYSASSNTFQYSTYSFLSTNVDLYKLTEVEIGGGGGGGSSDVPDNHEVYNLDSDMFASYFEKAEPIYTDSNWSTVTVIGDFKNAGNTAKGGVGYDVPKPVTLNWLGYDGTAKTVNIYNDDSKTDLEVSVTTTGSSAEIYNLIPNRTYYYEVKKSDGVLIASGSFRTEGHRRQMRVSTNVGYDYANNCRDLGGLRTTDGKTLCYEKIFRGTNMNGLNSTEQNYVTGYMNVRTDVDLRYKSSSSNAYANIAFTDQSLVYYCNPQFHDWKDLPDKTKLKMTFDSIISTVLAGNAVYIHCYIGSDRTGFICMLLEAACGVTEKDCTMDYELTSFSVAGTKDRASKYTDGANYFNDGINYIEGYKKNSTFQENARKILIDAGISESSLNSFISAMTEQ